MLFYCSNNIHELYFCSQCMSMINERHSIRPIPAIQFNAATTLPQTSYISFNWWLTGKLVSCQVAATVTRLVSCSFNINELQIYWYNCKHQRLSFLYAADTSEFGSWVNIFFLFCTHLSRNTLVSLHTL